MKKIALTKQEQATIVKAIYSNVVEDGEYGRMATVRGSFRECGVSWKFLHMGASLFDESVVLKLWESRCHDSFWGLFLTRV
jgi:hypothetical protein